jgi:hypothetical protein
MANEEHVARLKQGVDAWNTWRRENPCVSPDLSGVTIPGVNLSGANLIRVNLGRAILFEVNLNGADLGGADPAQHPDSARRNLVGRAREVRAGAGALTTQCPVSVALRSRLLPNSRAGSSYSG